MKPTQAQHTLSKVTCMQVRSHTHTHTHTHTHACAHTCATLPALSQLCTRKVLHHHASRSSRFFDGSCRPCEAVADGISRGEWNNTCSRRLKG